MKKAILLLVLLAMIFCGGCVNVKYLKETTYAIVDGKPVLLADKESLEYRSNDENIKTMGMKLKLSQTNGAELGVGERLDKGDPNLVRAYGLAGKDVVGTMTGTNVVEGLIKK
jgi:hypothetical protein